MTTMPTEVLDLHRKYEALHNKVNDALAEFDHRLQPDYAIAMAFIGEQKLVLADVRRRKYYIGTNSSYMLRILQKAGYVEKSPSLTDERSKLVSLTEKGLGIAGIVREALGGKNEQ